MTLWTKSTLCGQMILYGQSLNIQKAQLARREDARIKRLNQKHVSMKDNKTEQ